MPRIDGAQFIRKLRECSEWSDIPVLVCTSLTTSAVDGLLPEHNWKFIMKPISAERLVPKVEELLAHRKPAWQNPFETMSKIGLEPDAFFFSYRSIFGSCEKENTSAGGTHQNSV
jgi:DNA-binding response OmpR family regulator